MLSRRAWRALVAGPALMVSCVLPAFLVASLASQIELGGSAVGLAIAIFHVICAFGSTPAGRLVERIGPRAGMRIAATLTALSCLAIAALAHSALGLTALLIVGGVANAFGGPAVAALLRREVAVHRQGLAFGAQQSGGTLGSLLAGLALPLVAIPFGWRWAFLAVAVLALSAAALAPNVARAEIAAVRKPQGLTSVHALAVAAALASAAGVGFISFLILYAVHSGMSQGAAGLLLGAVSIAGYLLLIAGEPALIVVAALLAGAFGWAWPGGLTLAVVQRSPGAPAWAVGVLMAGLFTGAILGPLVIGILAEHERFAVAWGTCAACALLAALTVSATRRRQLRPQP